MFRRRKQEPGTGAGTPSQTERPRAWTFMVYLAGDNNLEEYGQADLSEIKQVGSTADVAIVAQFDSVHGGPTRRYYLQRGTPLEVDEIGPDLGETNTGDPRELVRFVAWAIESYPAQHYALILWNHGAGWKEDDLYRVAEAAGLPSAAAQRTVGALAHEMAQPAHRRPLFAPTLRAILARGIGYDDTSRDFLDNAELQRALTCSLLVGGIEKLTLIGFDACLMGMVEVAYQLRNVANYVVGSQEVEPGDGWPYQPILETLVARPTMDGEELATHIVGKYADSYGPENAVTQSALALMHTDGLAQALNELCTYILDRQQACELAVGWAARHAQKYADPDYKDLYDFCRLMGERSGDPQLQQRAQVVMDCIVPAGPGRLVCAEAHRGVRVTKSHGISVYFPEHEMSPFYKRLDFASESLWDDMLHRLVAAR